MTTVTITSPLGSFNTHRDPGTGTQVLAVDGVGVTAGGVVYLQPEGANAGEAAHLALNPDGTVCAVKETS